MSSENISRTELIAGGMLLALDSYGKENEKLPLLILPGWMSSASAWRGIATSLSEKRKVIVVDWPGFGGAPAPKRALNIEDYARATEEIIRRLGGRAHLLGHSFGGRVSIRTACRYPGIVDKLILLSSAGFNETSVRSVILRAFARTFKKIFQGTFLMSFAKTIGIILGARDALTAGSLRKTFEQVIFEDLSSDMKEISQSTLILWGKEDTVTPPEFAERIHALIQNSKIEWIEGATHISFLDKPDSVHSAIEHFLDNTADSH